MCYLSYPYILQSIFTLFLSGVSFWVRCCVVFTALLFSNSLFCQLALENQDLQSINEAIIDLPNSSKRKNLALELLKKATENGSEKGSFLAYTYLAQEDLAQKDYRNAIKNNSRALKRYNKNKWADAEIANNYNIMSKALEGIGAVSEAIVYQKLATKSIPENTKKKKSRFFSINRVGSLYMALKEYDSSLIYFKQGLEFAKLSRIKDLEAHSYNNMGLSFSNLEKKDSAASYFSLALDLYLSSEDTSAAHHFMISIIKGNLAQVLPNSDDRKHQYFEADINGSIAYNNFSNAISSSVYYAQFLREVGRKNDALSILLKAEEISKRHNVDADTQIELYDELCIIYALLGNSTKSVLYHNNTIELLQKTYGRHVVDKHMALYSSYELDKIEDELELEKVAGEKKAEEIKVLNKEQELARFRNWALGIITILVLTTSAFFINKIRSDAKKKAREKLMQERMLRLELEYNSERLNRSILSLNRKKEFANELMTRISAFDNLSITQKNSLKIYLMNEMDIDDSAITIEDDIQKFGEELVAGLRLNYPNLTEQDIQMLSYIQMGLTNKQIAEIKNIATDSVKMSKNRLRKKLGLAKGSDLKKTISPNSPKNQGTEEL